MAAVAGAQAPELPRLASGKPNFQGVWRNEAGSAAFDVQAHEAGYQIPAGPSVIVDPPDGKLPYLPAAKLQAARNWEQRFKDPVGLCHPHGVPRVMLPPFPMEIVQDGDFFAILGETSHEVRLIPTDGRPPRLGYRSYQGDSRGRWEGDTLVVNVRGLNGNIWLDQAGNLIDENATVEERFTMTSRDRFVYEARVTDPTSFSLPWTLRVTMARQPKGTELIEYDCVEGERDLEHYQNLEREQAKVGAKAKAVRK